jgi:hypothetical protein
MDPVLVKSAGKLAAKKAGRHLIGSARSPIHFLKDFAEIHEVIFFLAQESGQEEMGEFDGALHSIRDNKDDINLGKQPPEQLHLLKLCPVRN